MTDKGKQLKKWIRIKEASAHFGVPYNTLHIAIIAPANDIEHRRLGEKGRRIEVNRFSLKAYLDRQVVTKESSRRVVSPEERANIESIHEIFKKNPAAWLTVSGVHVDTRCTMSLSQTRDLLNRYNGVEWRRRRYGHSYVYAPMPEIESPVLPLQIANRGESPSVEKHGETGSRFIDDDMYDAAERFVEAAKLKVPDFRSANMTNLGEKVAIGMSYFRMPAVDCASPEPEFKTDKPIPAGRTCASIEQTLKHQALLDRARRQPEKSYTTFHDADEARHYMNVLRSSLGHMGRLTVDADGIHVFKLGAKPSTTKDKRRTDISPEMPSHEAAVKPAAAEAQS